MKKEALHKRLRGLGYIPEPRATNKELTKVLSNHFLALYAGPCEDHYEMRLLCEPEKAYRYDKVNEALQRKAMEEEYWGAQEKFNGWRVMLTFIPGKGVQLFGGNLSNMDFLPICYTLHTPHCALLEEFEPFKERQPFILDAEAIVADSVVNQKGRVCDNPLEAIGAILSSNAERAMELQEELQVVLKLFDYIPFKPGLGWGTEILPMGTSTRYQNLCSLYDRICACVPNAKQHFHRAEMVTQDKRRFLQTIWGEGKEGIILKHLYSPYTPGARDKYANLKVKRTMSGAIGDDLDAFIIGPFDTEEWHKKGLIGGVVLGVMKGDEMHIIAHVTNMPDTWRTYFTNTPAEDYINQVVVVDGQELTGANQRLQHAKVDWDRGFRKDKTPMDCTLAFETQSQF